MKYISKIYYLTKQNHYIWCVGKNDGKFTVFKWGNEYKNYGNCLRYLSKYIENNNIPPHHTSFIKDDRLVDVFTI